MRAMVLPLPHFRAHSACSSAMLRWVCGLLGGVLLGISLGGLLLPPVWSQQAPPAQQGISSADAMPVSALTPRWPIPGLAAGWVPQGLAFDHSGWMYLSSYRTASDAGNHSAAGAEVAASGGVGSAAAAASPTCRVTWLDPATGQARGHLDWPAGTCRHAGGLAWSPAGAQGSGRLWMADTTTLWRIDLPRTHATGPVIGARRAWQLCGALRGSFVTWDGQALWLGVWARHPAGTAPGPVRERDADHRRRASAAPGTGRGVRPRRHALGRHQRQPPGCAVPARCPRAHAGPLHPRSRAGKPRLRPPGPALEPVRIRRPALCNVGRAVSVCVWHRPASPAALGPAHASAGPGAIRTRRRQSARPQRQPAAMPG